MNNPPAQPPAKALSKAELGKLYTRLAPLYGFWGALTEERARERALQVAALAAGESVLEVAVGTGTFLTRLGEFPELRLVAGIDFAEGMIRRTARRLKTQARNGTFLCRADACLLPFADNTFDVLFNCYMLDLLRKERIPEVLNEFQRVLKPSGRLVVIVMAEQVRPVQAIWTGLYKLVPSLVGGCRPIAISDFLARADWRVELRECISQSGFRSDLFLARASSKG